MIFFLSCSGKTTQTDSQNFLLRFTESTSFTQRIKGKIRTNSAFLFICRCFSEHSTVTVSRTAGSSDVDQSGFLCEQTKKTRSLRTSFFNSTGSRPARTATSLMSTCFTAIVAVSLTSTTSTTHGLSPPTSPGLRFTPISYRVRFFQLHLPGNCFSR